MKRFTCDLVNLLDSRKIAAVSAGLLLIAAVFACGPNPTSDPIPTSFVKPNAAANAESNPTATLSAPLVSADEWRTYHNDELGYSVQVPPSWTIDDTDKNEVIIFVGPSNGLAGLHILALDWTSTLDQFVVESDRFHQRRAVAQFEALSDHQVEMATGLTARRLEYRVQNDSRFCVEILVDYLLVAGNLSYALQGSVCESALELYAEDTEKMQLSFKLDSDLAMAPAFPN